MKKMLIRAGMAPTDIVEPGRMIVNNTIGNNVGNLLYAYGVNRVLTLEDTEIIPNYYKAEAEKAEEINETYDAFIIPLADAFRNDMGMRTELRNMTALIRKLTIPCVVIGVGLRAPFEPELTKTYPFDEDVKEFIEAVLEKSAIVGVRGEITGRYLSNLGFKEEKDYTVIGCPSIYACGRELKIRDTSITEKSRISINSSILSPVNVLEFLERTMQRIEDHYFLPQRVQELKLVYTGSPYVHKEKDKEIYPCKMTDRIYRDNRVRFMLNVPTWLDFLKGVDLSIGGRLHGNLAAVVAGTPSILIPHDARMRELTEYHGLTHVWASEIDETTDVFELAAKLDFHSPEKCYKKNFEHYVDFLEKNGLEHIYKNGADLEKTPLDARIAQTELLLPLETIQSCTYEEMVERWQQYYPLEEKRSEMLKKDIKRMKRDMLNLERQMGREIRSLEKELHAEKNKRIPTRIKEKLIEKIKFS